jgi:hypothetical protein
MTTRDETDALILDATPSMDSGVRPTPFPGTVGDELALVWAAAMPVLPRIVDALGLTGRRINDPWAIRFGQDLTNAELFEGCPSGILADDAARYEECPDGWGEEFTGVRDWIAAGFVARLLIQPTETAGRHGYRQALVLVNQDGTRAAIIRGLPQS